MPEITYLYLSSQGEPIGFAVENPHGIILYLYPEREPSPEFKHYYKS